MTKERLNEEKFNEVKFNEEQSSKEKFEQDVAKEQEKYLNKIKENTKINSDMNQGKDISVGDQKYHAILEGRKYENKLEETNTGNFYETVKDVNAPPVTSHQNDPTIKGKGSNIPSIYFLDTTIYKKDINNPHINKQLDEMHPNRCGESTHCSRSIQPSEHIPPSYPYTSQPVGQERQNQFDYKQPIAQARLPKQFDNMQGMSQNYSNCYQSMPQSTQRRQVDKNKFFQDDQFAQYRPKRNLSQNQLAYVTNEQPSPQLPISQLPSPQQPVIPNETPQLDQNKKYIEQGKMLLFPSQIKLKY